MPLLIGQGASFDEVIAAIQTWAGKVENGLNRFTFASGTYTPRITNAINVTSSLAYACQYIRVGEVVTVSGRVNVEPTAAAATFTQLGISLPVASYFLSPHQLAGVGSAVVSGSGFDEHATLYAGIEVDWNRANLNFFAATSDDHGLFFTFTYHVIT